MHLRCSYDAPAVQLWLPKGQVMVRYAQLLEAFPKGKAFL